MLVDRHGNLVSAIKVFPLASKDNKLQVNEDQYIFYDNVLLEMNVRPAKTLREFLQSFKECFDFTQDQLRKKSMYLKVRASSKFPLTQCEDADACIFGCDPEFCIYSRTADNKIMRVEPPVLPMGNTFRSCGGHIHIGHLIATVEHGDPGMVVKLMDGFVGATALLIDPDETSAERRKLYGGAGTHRVSSYGVEYRTLSNFWLSSPKYVDVIYNLTRFVINQALTNPNVVDRLIDAKDLQEIINKGKEKDAEELFKKLGRSLPFDLQENIEKLRTARTQVNVYDEWSRIKREAA
jgi:hypothetical protein